MWAQRLKVEVMWVVGSISGLCSPKGVAHSTLPHPSHSYNHTHTLEQSRGSFSPRFSSLNIKIKNKIPNHSCTHIFEICLTSQARSPSCGCHFSFPGRCCLHSLPWAPSSSLSLFRTLAFSLPELQEPGGRTTLLPASTLRKRAEVSLQGSKEKEGGPWRVKRILRKNALNQTQISRILAKGLEKIAIKLNCFLYECSLYLGFPQCAILSLRLGEQMRFWKCWLTYPFFNPFSSPKLLGAVKSQVKSLMCFSSP